MAAHSQYYVPHSSRLPLVASAAMLVLLVGLGVLLNVRRTNPDALLLPALLPIVGLIFLCVVIFYWFRIVVAESHQGLHEGRMDLSYRWGMGWFIFTEVMFFAVFFGALFYARNLAVPWLSGEGDKTATVLLWPEFIGTWPLFENPDPEAFKGPRDIINPLHVPLLNTIILISSSFTVTWAHHALKENRRKALTYWLATTICLGLVFLYLQAAEYVEAYVDLDLRLDSGIYGSTFFMLTGFHGAHVTLGTIMLIVMLFRVLAGHFTPQRHFGFEAVSWYWHFVDVVWIGLFLFVYIL